MGYSDKQEKNLFFKKQNIKMWTLSIKMGIGHLQPTGQIQGHLIQPMAIGLWWRSAAGGFSSEYTPCTATEAVLASGAFPLLLPLSAINNRSSSRYILISTFDHSCVILARSPKRLLTTTLSRHPTMTPEQVNQ